MFAHTTSEEVVMRELKGENSREMHHMASGRKA